MNNYYTRSSVLGKVVTEIDVPGKKQNTFIPANGATIAEQELVTISGTTSEKLSFIHQDASGASVQQTNAVGALTSGSGTRAGEYDALGRNVADASPFISLNSEPPPSETGGSGVNMSGTSAGYRPGQQIYRIDGQVVSQTEFMETVNGALIGGAFGLLEMQTRMSAQPPQQIGYWRQTETWSENQGLNNYTRETNIGNVYADNNWQMITSIISFTQQQTQQNPYTETPLTEKDKTQLKNNLKNFTSNETCNKFITSILEKLKSTGRAGYDTTNINKLFEMILGNKNNVFLSVNYTEVWEQMRLKGVNMTVPNAFTNFGSTNGTKRTTMRFDSYQFGFAQGSAWGRPYPYSQLDANTTLVHELIHAFGNTEYFSHGDQAGAAFASATEMGIDVKAAPNRRDFINPVTGKVNEEAFDLANSTYFGKVLKKACSGGK